eukprot:TRINITY_DN521_c0_g1_i2.p1 TRINITY_DN521_c0_g1~~TRINITY_DN521_c0_g1_i2.p1  ORF type:complete len:236 (-),score=31.93 TRINITY_DN521_c0_g1_i2:1326-2033(-)
MTASATAVSIAAAAAVAAAAAAAAALRSLTASSRAVPSASAHDRIRGGRGGWGCCRGCCRCRCCCCLALIGRFDEGEHMHDSARPEGFTVVAALQRAHDAAVAHARCHLADLFRDPVVVILSELHLPKQIVLVCIKPGADEDDARLELLQRRQHTLDVRRSECLGTCAAPKSHIDDIVELAALALSACTRVEFLPKLVGRCEEGVPTSLQPLLRAVPVLQEGSSTATVSTLAARA